LIRKNIIVGADFMSAQLRSRAGTRPAPTKAEPYTKRGAKRLIVLRFSLEYFHKITYTMFSFYSNTIFLSQKGFL
jgi:hypothetical protein